MALFDDMVEGLTSSWVPSVLVGVGVALVAPIVVPALAGSMRPLAMAVVKGGMMVYDKGAEVIAEASEQLSDMVAEARSELDAAAAAASAHANGHTTDF
jgi:hypothetical protein